MQKNLSWSKPYQQRESSQKSSSQKEPTTEQELTQGARPAIMDQLSDSEFLPSNSESKQLLTDAAPMNQHTQEYFVMDLDSEDDASP